MNVSTVTRGAPVSFPEFTGERVYMRRFERGAPLPDDLARWQETVDSMLVGVESDGPCFLMIDQMYVPSGKYHRRPGLHVDWYWHDILQAHGSPGHRPVPGHQPRPQPKHGPERKAHEAVVLAASSLGCRAYRGAFEGRPLDDGDAAHIDVSGLEVVDMAPRRAWICDAGSTLHETLPELNDTFRTVVRLNVAGWRP